MNITHDFDGVSYTTTDKLKLADKREIEKILEKNI